MLPPARPIILTRPAGRNQALAQALHAHGCTTLELPALRLVPVSAHAHTLPRPTDYDLVVFVSGAAACAYAEQVQRLSSLARWPAHVPIACVGPASAAHLCGDFWPAGLRVLYPEPPPHDSEALWEVLRPELPALRRVLLVRGTSGRAWLSERLTQAGIAVHLHAVYHRQPADWSPAARATLAHWHAEERSLVWLITSGESLAALHAHITHAGWLDWWHRHSFVLTHPRIAERLRSLLGPRPQPLCAPTLVEMTRVLLASSLVSAG